MMWPKMDERSFSSPDYFRGDRFSDESWEVGAFFSVSEMYGVVGDEGIGMFWMNKYIEKYFI